MRHPTNVRKNTKWGIKIAPGEWHSEGVLRLPIAGQELPGGSTPGKPIGRLLCQSQLGLDDALFSELASAAGRMIAEVLRREIIHIWDEGHPLVARPPGLSVSEWPKVTHGNATFIFDVHPSCSDDFVPDPSIDGTGHDRDTDPMYMWQGVGLSMDESFRTFRLTSGRQRPLLRSHDLVLMIRLSRAGRRNGFCHKEARSRFQGVLPERSHDRLNVFLLSIQGQASTSSAMSSLRKRLES